MAESQTAEKSRQRAPKRAAETSATAFSAEEKAAVKERAKEMKAAARRGSGAKKEEGEGDVLGKIAEMGAPDRALAERVHAIVTGISPDLWPRTWYGMPAYAKDGNVVCFFKPAEKFKARYATLGFSDKANLDDGAMWPTEFAVTKMTADVEKRITALVKTAIG